MTIFSKSLKLVRLIFGANIQIYFHRFCLGSLIIWSHYESPFLSNKPFDQKEKVPNESESVINTQASNSVLSKFPTTAVLLDFGGGAAVEITEFSYSCSLIEEHGWKEVCACRIFTEKPDVKTNTETVANAFLIWQSFRWRLDTFWRRSVLEILILRAKRATLIFLEFWRWVGKRCE